MVLNDASSGMLWVSCPCVVLCPHLANPESTAPSQLVYLGFDGGIAKSNAMLPPLSTSFSNLVGVQVQTFQHIIGANGFCHRQCPSLRNQVPKRAAGSRVRTLNNADLGLGFWCRGCHSMFIAMVVYPQITSLMTFRRETTNMCDTSSVNTPISGWGLTLCCLLLVRPWQKSLFSGQHKCSM